ncbi:MAG: type secretion system protein GspD [Pseudomonadota bacterium]
MSRAYYPKARYGLILPLLTLVGCEYLGPEGYHKIKLPASLTVEKEPVRDVAMDDLRDAQTDSLKEPEYYPPSGGLVGGGHTMLHAGSKPGKGGKAGKAAREGKYTLNFDDAEMSEVAKVILGDTLKINYVISPKVTGKVSLQTTRPLTDDEMIPTLEMLLHMNAAVLIHDHGMYRIEPDAQALVHATSSGLGLRGAQLEPGYQVRVIPVRFVGVGEMQKVLEPMMPPKSIIKADEIRNLLVVAGTAEELASVIDTVSIFDVDFMRGMSVALYPMKNIDATTMAEELSKILGDGKKGPLGSMLRVMPIERLNAVLAVTPQVRYLEEVEMWIARLDRYSTTRSGNVHVYYAQHVEAAQLAQTLATIFGQSQQGGGRSGGPSLAPGLTGGSIATSTSASDADSFMSGGGTGASAGGAGTTSATEATSFMSGGGDSSSGSGMSGSSFGGSSGGMGAGSSMGSGGMGGSGGIGGASSRSGSGSGLGRGGSGSSRLGAKGGIVGAELANNARIVADPVNNALVIIAKAQDYKEIEVVLKQLDVMPLQVLLDASIFEVGLTGDLKYGLKWLLRNGSQTEALGGTISDVISAGADGGFTYLAAANGNRIRILLDALAKDSRANVISSPSLMVLNNQQAKINVGDQVPVVTGGISSGIAAGGSTGITSSFQMQQSGVTLEIRPRVNAGGLVSMDVFQAISTPQETKVGNDQTTFKFANREIQTTVAVPNGETIVLGGLIRDERTEEKQGLPFLYKIPWLGVLFGSTSINTTKTELVVLITPRVVQHTRDITSVSNEFRSRMSEIYDISPTPGMSSRVTSPALPVEDTARPLYPAR